jgi:radical SAM protein with 4Fe4S-binding SPASM domain
MGLNLSGRKLSHIDMEITRRCNLDCIHCSAAAKNRGKEMSIQSIERVLVEAKSIGLEMVGLTGGEPFCSRAKLTRIGNFCKDELHIPIHIHSNGTRITAQDAKWIKQKGAEITVPLYGNNATIHDQITNMRGSFESGLRGLRTLVKADANICLYIVPMKQNLQSIQPLIKKAYTEGIRRVRILSLSPTGRAKARFEKLELSVEDVEKLNAKLLSIRKTTGMEINTGFSSSRDFRGLSILKGHERCFAAENRVHIDTFGNVFPCTASSGQIAFSAGNLQAPENSLLSIWMNSPLFQLFRYFHRNPPTKCSQCKRHDDCSSGCRVRMWYKHGDVAIADPACGGPYN